MKPGVPKDGDEMLDAALLTLRNDGYRVLAVGIAASQCGLKRPDYVVALVLRPNGLEHSVVWADHKGVTELSGADRALDMYGDFVMHLFLGDAAEFDTTQRATP